MELATGWQLRQLVNINIMGGMLIVKLRIDNVVLPQCVAGKRVSDRQLSSIFFCRVIAA
jgi:uncharacterized protein YlaN (UPF0358 family)